ncbi:MAG: class I SAM-dependent methyltransferase [Bacteroidales bacterium]|nr:class I SAM-dependent methyltransferase [Bacteroidales bacterium]MDT8432221.1 class I SAM-dependent methyltransferase [Bacteroidales bacterium]
MMHFTNIYNAIKNASEKPLETHEILSGYSGEKLLATLMNLSRYNLDDDKVYLEVGVFQGLSLLSVANSIGNNVAFGIDNFAFFDKDGKNESIVHSRIDKLNLKNVRLINQDYEDALENLGEYIGDKKVGVFFIDGPHDYRSQLMCLLLIKPYLSDDAVIIIDDSNYRHVRQANRDFLQTNNDYKLFFEAYTPSHPDNMSKVELEQAKHGWWNGVNVIVRDGHHQLQQKFPSTFRNRTLYENEHILHTAKYPTLNLKLSKYSRFLGNIIRIFPKYASMEKGKYPASNTYSEDLCEINFTQDL